MVIGIPSREQVEISVSTTVECYRFTPPQVTSGVSRSIVTVPPAPAPRPRATPRGHAWWMHAYLCMLAYR